MGESVIILIKGKIGNSNIKNKYASNKDKSIN